MKHYVSSTSRAMPPRSRRKKPTQTLKSVISAHYSRLSPQLRKAADFVLAHPTDVASNSLRSLSRDSGFAPATFTRLAQALGFDGFSELRDLARTALVLPDVSFSEKAAQLMQGASGDKTPHLFHRQSLACIRNIEAAMQMIEPCRLDAAARRLRLSRRVLLYGALGSAGIAEYMSYMAGFFASNWTMVEDRGAPLGPSLSRLSPSDAIVVITMPPSARKAVLAAQEAARRGAYVMVITNTLSSPALKFASESFVVPSDSPQFFTSYTATLAVLEALVGVMVSQNGTAALSAISQSEAENLRLQDYWPAKEGRPET